MWRLWTRFFLQYLKIQETAPIHVHKKQKLEIWELQIFKVLGNVCTASVFCFVRIYVFIFLKCWNAAALKSRTLSVGRSVGRSVSRRSRGITCWTIGAGEMLKDAVIKRMKTLFSKVAWDCSEWDFSGCYSHGQPGHLESRASSEMWSPCSCL